MANQVANLVEFIFQGEDYFVGHLDNGGITIGIVSSRTFAGHRTDFLAGHEMYTMVLECGQAQDEEAVEILSDEIYSIHLQGGDCRILLTA